MDSDLKPIGEEAKSVYDRFFLPINGDLYSLPGRKGHTKLLMKKLESIDLKSAFSTTGDAIEKCKALEAMAWRLAGSLRKLRRLCERTKGKHRRLETAPNEDGQIISKVKDSREDMKARKKISDAAKGNL